MGASQSSPKKRVPLVRIARCEEPPPPPPDAIEEAAQAAATPQLHNPGPYESLANEAKRLVQFETFDGFRCDINKQVSPFMGVFHSFWLGTQMLPDAKSSYTFTTQVANETSLYMARVDPGRQSIDGRIHQALGPAMFKLQVSGSPDGQSDQLLTEVDLQGATWNANLKYGSAAGGILTGGNYVQAITPRLTMGGEGLYVAANGNQISNYTIQYTMPAKTGEEGTLQVPDHSSSKQQQQPPKLATLGGSSMFLASFQPSQMMTTLNYRRVVTPNRVTLGAQLQFGPAAPSELAVGAEFQLSRSTLQLCAHGNGRLQTLVQAKLGLAPGSPSLQLSADVNHFTEEMRFGYGITMEG